MAFEDDLLALEQRVLTEAAGNFLLAVAELRDMLTKGTPGITRKLVSLAIPDIEARAKAGVLEGFALGGQRALDLVHSVDSPVDDHGQFQADIVPTQPPGALTTPLDGLNELVADAHRRSVLLVRGGADIETSLSPIFGAATTTRSRIETQINAASNTAALMVGEAARTPMVWISERDACVYCLALAGHVVERPGDQFPRADLYAEPPRSQPIVQQPPLHPHCLPGDALVTSGSRVTGATSRVYEGEMVRVRTLSGKELSATPNHPVLTDRGWVALGELRVGDRVISRSGSERPLVRHSNGEHVPTPIGEIAEAAFGSGQMLAAEVPMSTEDFHGDGTKGEVAHVATSLHLPAEHLPSTNEHVGKLALDVTGHALAGSNGARDPLPMCLGLLAPPDGSVGSVSEARALVWSGVRHALEHGSGPATWFDAAVQQSTTNNPTADPEAVGDALLALTGEVVADELVSVERYAFHGPVYNIETETGWYIGNGIVVHNCRCQLSILVDRSFSDALQREAQRSILRGFALPSESNAVRVRAAERLLARDPVAPKSVKAFAAKAIKAGKFPTRDVPAGDPRLIIR